MAVSSCHDPLCVLCSPQTAPFHTSHFPKPPLAVAQANPPVMQPLVLFFFGLLNVFFLFIKGWILLEIAHWARMLQQSSRSEFTESTACVKALLLLRNRNDGDGSRKISTVPASKFAKNNDGHVTDSLIPWCFVSRVI